jgi:hypothetical protein
MELCHNPLSLGMPHRVLDYHRRSDVIWFNNPSGASFHDILGKTSCNCEFIS